MKASKGAVWAAALSACALSVCSLCGCIKAAVGDVTNRAQSQSSTPSVYLASPFFNETELANVQYAESVLDERGIPYYSPRSYKAQGEAGSLEWAHEIYEVDRQRIETADVVVALYYGSNGDTGTAWECGYATAIGKPVVLVHVDKANGSNLMLNCSSTTNITLDELAEYDFAKMPAYEFDGEML